MEKWPSHYRLMAIADEIHEDNDVVEVSSWEQIWYSYGLNCGTVLFPTRFYLFQRKKGQIFCWYFSAFGYEWVDEKV